MQNDNKAIKYENLPVELVYLVLNGTEEGYEKLLAYYENYINKLCLNYSIAFYYIKCRIGLA